MQERRQQILAAALSPDQEHDRRKALLRELQDFLRSPLNCRQSRSIWSRSLSNLAFAVLSAETDRQALIEVENWCKTWLEQHQIDVQDDTFEQLTHQVHFAVLTAVLDNRLGFLVDHLTELSQSRIVDLHDLDHAIVRRPPHDYLPVVPEAPVGNILGFLYKCDRRNFKNSGKLEYFRYVGVGRTLLLRFPTLFAVDGWDGAHTVLISGTSYAPGSPSYHINVQPTVLLKSAQKDSLNRSGIHASEFFFAPMRRPTDGKFIQLSGLPVAQRRLAADQLVKAMCESPGKVPSFLTKCFQELAELERTHPEWWSDRQRLLIVVGSYDEADWVGEILRPLYRLEQIDEGVATLRRDNAPARAYSLRRGEISELRHTPTQIVIAPLMALERGHNILNAQKQAAIGAVLFLNRPMPIPDDWQFTVRQLNNWALAQDSALFDVARSEDEAFTLTGMGDIFYLNAMSEMLNLNCTAFSFQQLTAQERQTLCWTQLVSIWQIIGRLLRGNVPAKVYFIDAKFAPQLAYGLADSEATSLLVGIIKALRFSRDNAEHAYERTLLRSLYDIFLEKLENIFKDSNNEL